MGCVVSSMHIVSVSRCYTTLWCTILRDLNQELGDPQQYCRQNEISLSRPCLLSRANLTDRYLFSPSLP